MAMQPIPPVDPNEALRKATGTAKPATPKPTSSVADNLRGLLQTDNPYMVQARTSGLQTANRRGLLNSSMAAGASESAAIAAAMPIAQQDAQLAGSKELSTQDFNQNKGLQTQRIQADQLAQQRDINAQKAADKVRIDADAKKTNLDRASQEKVAQWNLNANEQKGAADMVSTAQSQYQAEYNAIMGNTNLSATARMAAIKRADQSLANRINLVQSFYNVKLTWPKVTTAPKAAPKAAPKPAPKAPAKPAAKPKPAPLPNPFYAGGRNQ